MVNTSSIQLNPWKDGFIETRIKLLDKKVSKATTVYVIFNEDDFTEYMYDREAIALFEAVGSILPKLESVIIRLDVASSTDLPPSDVAIPPIQALTSLLLAENNKVKYLTMLNLRLEGNDLDMNGMVEAIRIHPSLHSVVVKRCTFSRHKHLDQLRATLTSRDGMKHCDLLENIILSETCWANSVVCSKVPCVIS